MKLNFENDVEQMMTTVTKELEDWEDNARGHTFGDALALCAHLSILKLLIGIEKFDSLPYFTLKLKEATDIINSTNSKSKTKNN